MEVRTIRVGHTETNCYIVYDKEKGEASVIDPRGGRNNHQVYFKLFAEDEKYLFDPRPF